ncbi:MAG TPA: Gfo/Idh/MocA family oxidoreductase [Acidobacteriota bacterium]|nr:Gfo/Idh/MocA family oxidoreductase [Acidobacteriota bacterium]
MKPKNLARIGRREFLSRAGSAAGVGVMVMNSSLVRGTQANSAVRIGLLGCGGRGTSVARGFVNNASARVVALADLFEGQLTKAQDVFNRLAEDRGRPRIANNQIFSGPEADHLISQSSEVDAVIIATPAYFHPEHLDAVVSAGKHVYCEKPVAVDVAGCKKVLEIGQKAQNKQTLHVGFQIRNAPPFVELVRRIHNGALGTIASGEAYYFGTTINRPDWPGATAEERRLRNWIYDRVLSGDIIVEQNIHAIDICNWILRAHPIAASGAGGRKVRNDHGDCYDHFNVVYTYPNDVHVSFSSTQFNKGWWGVNERFFGSKGVSQSPYSGPLGIWGDEPWQADGQASNQGEFSASGEFQNNLAEADAEKQRAFVRSITSGAHENQAKGGVESALSAILGREAAYQGRKLTWEELLASDQTYDAGLNLQAIVS